MLKQKILSAAVTVVLFLPQAQEASAATLNVITGGETQVQVTADLAGLGLTAFAFGSATFNDALFTFPISGGSASTSGDLLIEHDGSGVTLQALAAPTVSATVANFLIDTSNGAVFGDLIGGPDDLRLFDFGTIDDRGIGLEISTVLAGALTAVFDAPNLSGATFGYATAAPELSPVPLPAGLPTLLAGIALLMGLGQRSRV